MLLAVVLGSGTGSASAAGSKKLVEGTVYDTTCASSCMPECPPIPCGPVTQSAQGAVICAYRRIVCPLAKAAVVCVRAPCPGVGGYPVYSGEGGVVKVRKRGSATVQATLPIVEGHFQIRLAPGYYELHPFLPEPECWTGAKQEVLVTPKATSPVPSELWVANSCVAHPAAK